MNQRDRAVIAASLQRVGIPLPSNMSRPATTVYDTRSAIDRPVPVVSARAADKPTLFISSDAREAFRLVDFDHLEMGGGLYGRLVGDVIRVDAICESAYLRHRHSMRLDTFGMERMAEHFGAAGYARIGDWHSHIVERVTPSEGDLRGWAVCAERFRRPYVGLIVSPRDADSEHGADWSRPAFSAWLVHPGGSTATPLRRITFGQAFL